LHALPSLYNDKHNLGMAAHSVFGLSYQMRRLFTLIYTIRPYSCIFMATPVFK